MSNKYCSNGIHTFVQDSQKPNRYVCLTCGKEEDITEEKEKRTPVYVFFLVGLAIATLSIWLDKQQNTSGNEVTNQVIRVIKETP